MILSKEDVQMTINVLIGDEMDSITKMATYAGVTEGTHKFINSIKDVTKEFCGERLKHNMELNTKVKVMKELGVLLTGFCKTFRAGVVAGKLSSAKIIKPSLKVVKTVNKSKIH